MAECGQCGRKFRADRIQKHVEICKKASEKKRKKFNVAEHRWGDLDEGKDQVLRNASKVEAEVKAKPKEAAAKPAAEAKAKEGDGKPVPAWKKKSLEFRAAMLAMKAAAGDEAAIAKSDAVNQELAKAAAAAPPDPDKIVCPSCGRTFNKESGERHIPICKGQAGRLVRGGGMNCNSKAGPAPHQGGQRPAPKRTGPGRTEPPTSHHGGAAVRQASNGPGSRRPPVPHGRG